MKNLILGLLALTLVVWPIIAWKAVSGDQHAHARREPSELPLVASWMAGFAFAVYGSFARDDKSPSLRLLGRILCVGTVCLQIGIILYGVVFFAAHIHEFGVN